MSASSAEKVARDAWAGAVEMMRRRLATVEGLLGTEHAETADCLTYLGSLLHDVGRLHEAEPCFRRAYGIRAELLGVEHPRTRESVDDLVGTLLELDDFAGAEPLLWQELAMVEKEDGRGHPDVAPVLVCLSECLRVRGQMDEAVALLERALTIIRAHEGDDAEDAIFAAERIDALRQEVEDATTLSGQEGNGEGAETGEVPC